MIISICEPTACEFTYKAASMCISSLRAFSTLHGISIHEINRQRARVEVARNEMVEQAMALESDYILWIDDDMTFPQETLIDLLDRNKDIIGCNAAKRDGSGTLAIKKDINGKKFNFKKGGIKQVRYIGMAVTLVKMDVYRNMAKPYYYAEYGETGYNGEDECFCREATDAGYKIWCDVSLSTQIGHIGPEIYKIGRR